MAQDLGFPDTLYLGHSMQKVALNHGLGHLKPGWVYDITPYQYNWTKIKLKVYHPKYGTASAPHAHDYYVGGVAKPNYPVPTKMGQVKMFPMQEVLVVDDVDERFDPVFTWDCINGIWPSDSPNNR